MSAEIVELDPKFDGTHMTPDEIRQEARRRGWYGLRLDARDFIERGELIVWRLTKRDTD